MKLFRSLKGRSFLERNKGGALIEVVSILAVVVGLIATMATTNTIGIVFGNNPASLSTQITHDSQLANLELTTFPGLVLNRDLSLTAAGAATVQAAINQIAQRMINSGTATTADICMWGYDVSGATVNLTGITLIGHPCAGPPPSCPAAVSATIGTNERDRDAFICYFNRTTARTTLITAHLTLGPVDGHAAIVSAGNGIGYSVN